MSVIGVDPDKYWKYTLRELNYIEKAKEFDVTRLQLVEHAMYDVQYNAMNGKKLFKMHDLRKKFPLLYKEQTKVLTGEAANNFLQGISNKNN